MGARGRAARPVELKMLEGNTGHRPINEARPKPPACIPDPPTWLAGEALEEWSRIAPVLLQYELITELDRAALVAYCTAWADLVRAERALEEHGLTFEMVEKNYVGQRPEVAIGQRAKDSLLRWTQQFGMSPSSRGRMIAPHGAEKEVDDGVLD